jgi:ABC-2 type transport system permease protein
MNTVVMQLTLRSLLSRRRVAFLLLLPAALLVLSALVRWVAGPGEGVAANMLNVFALGGVIPLLGLIAGSGSIGPEIDDGSIVYLLAKPLNRFVIVVSKLAVAIGVVLAFGALPTVLAGFVLAGFSDNPAADLILGFALAAAAASVAYSALFLLLGVLTRNAVVLGLLYALVWETTIGGFVPGAQALSVRQWALTLTERVLGPAAERLGAAAAVALPVGVVLLLVTAVAATTYAGHRLRGLRITGAD